MQKTGKNHKWFIRELLFLPMFCWPWDFKEPHCQWLFFIWSILSWRHYNFGRGVVLRNLFNPHNYLGNFKVYSLIYGQKPPSLYPSGPVLAPPPASSNSRIPGGSGHVLDPSTSWQVNPPQLIPTSSSSTQRSSGTSAAGQSRKTKRQGPLCPLTLEKKMLHSGQYYRASPENEEESLTVRD